MVERVLCMHEAQGSIPCSSIFFFFFFGVIRDRYPAPPFLSFFWGGFFWGVFFLLRPSFSFFTFVLVYVRVLNLFRPLCIITLKKFVALKVELLGQTFLKTTLYNTLNSLKS